MIFGMYPEVIGGGAEAEKKLKSLAESYLYKDVLQFQNICNNEAIEKLLQALALQIGIEIKKLLLAKKNFFITRNRSCDEIDFCFFKKRRKNEQVVFEEWGAS